MGTAGGRDRGKSRHCTKHSTGENLEGKRFCNLFKDSIVCRLIIGVTCTEYSGQQV